MICGVQANPIILLSFKFGRWNSLQVETRVCVRAWVCRCWCVKCRRASRKVFSRRSAASLRRRSTLWSVLSRTAAPALIGRRQVTWPSRCPPTACCSRRPLTCRPQQQQAPLRCLRSKLPLRPASPSSECRFQTGLSPWLSLIRVYV